jgi:hypothetical protein
MAAARSTMAGSAHKSWTVRLSRCRWAVGSLAKPWPSCTTVDHLAYARDSIAAMSTNRRSDQESRSPRKSSRSSGVIRFSASYVGA